MKVTIELELSDIHTIAAIHSLIQLLERYEHDQGIKLNDYNFLDDDEFWIHFLPNALCKVMDALGYLITDWKWDPIVLAQLFSGNDWETAIAMLQSKGNELHELFRETNLVAEGSSNAVAYQQ
jgi:hypothetical protein